MGLFNKKQETEDQIVDRLCGNAGNVVAMFQHVLILPQLLYRQTVRRGHDLYVEA